MNEVLKDETQKVAPGRLVLSRKPGERVNLGSDVVVEVLSVRGNKIRLGFVAPRSIRIVRAELDDLPGEKHGKAA